MTTISLSVMIYDSSSSPIISINNIFNMFKVNSKKVLLKIPTIYDFQPTVSQEVRKSVIQYVLQRNPNLQIKGGNSLTNPYKVPYELVMAESREAMQVYKNSGTRYVWVK